MLSSSAEGIDGDETLYRRVPVKMKWYDPVTGRLSPEAFHPNRKDESGISLDRKKYRTLEEAAQGPHMDGYYVAVLRAAELQAHGITVAAKPNAGNPGHAEIPRLNYAERRIDRCKEWQKLLAHELTVAVEGPFVSAPPGPKHADGAAVEDHD